MASLGFHASAAPPTLAASAPSSEAVDRPSFSNSSVEGQRQGEPDDSVSNGPILSFLVTEAPSPRKSASAAQTEDLRGTFCFNFVSMSHFVRISIFFCTKYYFLREYCHFVRISISFCLCWVPQLRRF